MNTVISSSKILVFDDDRDYRALLRSYLNRYLEDVSVTEYDPVTDGIPDDDFNWSEYDVMILDYDLGNNTITGLDLLHQKRRKQGFPAVIMLTGALDEDIAVKAVDFGVSGFLRKDNLDKMQLVDAVRSAGRRHSELLQKQDALEKTSRSFDKAGFYKRLGQRGEKGEPDHVFLYVDLDDFSTHVSDFGLIVTANLLHFIAKHVFDFFEERKKITNITRISDSSIGLLIDHPDTIDQLDKLVRALCTCLDKLEYIHDDQHIPFTVSIGVQKLHMELGDNRDLVNQLKSARDIARKSKGNSYHIHSSGDTGKTQPPGKEKEYDSQQAGRTTPYPEQSGFEFEDNEVREAFEESRSLKWFHPIVSTSLDDAGRTPPIMKISVGMISKDGTVISPQELQESINSNLLKQYIDRWILRELLGRIINNEKSKTNISYMLSISDSWLTDISLFNWLKDLLSSLGRFKPAQFLILSASADILNRNKRRAVALLSSLKKSYKFQLALSGIKINDETTWPDGTIMFDYGIMSANEILDYPDFSGNIGQLLKNIKTLKSRGLYLVFNGIENSTMLTDVISFGADFVMGSIIDESQSTYTTVETIEAL